MPDSPSEWVQHTLHCFEASIQTLELGLYSREFVAVHPDFYVDIVSSRSDDNVWAFTLNDRNLDFAHVHRTSQTRCIASNAGEPEGSNSRHSTSETTVCDCGAKRLFEILVAEMCSMGATIKPFMACDNQNVLLSRLPRNISVDVEVEPETHKVCASISWSVLQPQLAHGFEITLSQGSLGRELQDHQDLVPGVSGGDSDELEDVDSLRLSTKSTFKKIRDLPVGIEYNVAIKESDPLSPYSVPFTFTTVPSPANVRAAHHDAGLIIQWDCISETLDLSYTIRGYSQCGEQNYEVTKIDGQSYSIGTADFIGLAWVGVSAVYTPTKAISNETKLCLADIIKKPENCDSGSTDIPAEPTSDSEVRPCSQCL